MARDSRYDILFEPVRIGPKVMRNRFYQAAHCMGAGSERPGFQATFRAMKAEGGWAAVSTESCAIAPETDAFPRVNVRLWDDGDIGNLSLLCDMLHERNSLAAIELWHGGPMPLGEEARMPRRGASSMSLCARGRLTNCREMDKSDIRNVQALYVAAAERAATAGFDIITMYAAHGGALIHQFLIPLFNRRTDEYGGSFDNRARFGREALELVREAVGDRCAVSCRFGVDTLDRPWGLGESGIRADGDGYAFIELCDHLVDLWDITVGWTEWGEDAGPSRTHTENHERDYVNGVKDHTSKPVMNVGRIVNPDTMAEMIRSKQCDIIGAARPSIADPFLPLKIEEGRLDEIRECIGCNVCVSRWEMGGPAIICTQNATSGEEFRRGWHPEQFSKASNHQNDVLIVGSGPAGMECAIVLAKRGMRRVHLVDSEAEMGGCMKWIPQLPGLGDWARVVGYRRIQIEKLKNVEFIGGLTLGGDAIKDYGADVVILATGSSWASDGMNGVTLRPIPGASASASHVVTPEQLIVGGKAVGHDVVLLDAEGYFMGVGLSERLARAGHRVTYITPLETVAPYTHLTLEAPRINRTLRALGVTILTEHMIAEIGADHVTAIDVWDAQSRNVRQIECDSTVLVTQRNSNDGVCRELNAASGELAGYGIKGLYQIGDCVVPQLLADAIFSGHRLAREIDSPDPATHMPYVRERRLLQATEADFALDKVRDFQAGQRIALSAERDLDNDADKAIGSQTV